jgi:hypothetical protein
MPPMTPMLYRSRGGGEIAVAVIPMTALQLDQGHVCRGPRPEAGEGCRKWGSGSIRWSGADRGTASSRGAKNYRLVGNQNVEPNTSRPAAVCIAR